MSPSSKVVLPRITLSLAANEIAGMNRSEASKQIARSSRTTRVSRVRGGVPFLDGAEEGDKLSKTRGWNDYSRRSGAEWVGPFECTLTERLTDQFKWDLFWIAGCRSEGKSGRFLMPLREMASPESTSR